MMNDTQYKFDPQFDALLDEALRPEAPPADLVDRIFAATRGQLPRRHRSVIARIGHVPPALRAVAAAIVLAACVGVVLMSGLIVRDAKQSVALTTEIDALAQYEAPADDIDSELTLLAMELDMALQGGSAGSDRINMIDQLRAFEDELVGVNMNASF
jgi:hypothetical protein